MTSMKPLGLPMVDHVMQQVRGGATVDKDLVLRALDAGREERIDLKAETQLVQDILTHARDITPAAREALEAFIAAARPAQTKGLDGLLSRWRGKSPEPRADLQSQAHGAAESLLRSSSKDVLANVLGKVDPVLAETVRVDSKYSVGLAGLAKLFPQLGLALEKFDAEREPASALMASMVAAMPPPPAFVDVAAELKRGVPLDLKHALDLLRAAQHEGRDLGEVSLLAKDAATTEAAAAFLEGFTQSRSGSVGDRYHRAYRSEYRARSTLDAFDKALADVNPKLAELGHSALLLTGKYQAMNDAWQAIDTLMSDRSIENWSDAARQILRDALATPQNAS